MHEPQRRGRPTHTLQPRVVQERGADGLGTGRAAAMTPPSCACTSASQAVALYSAAGSAAETSAGDCTTSCATVMPAGVPASRSSASTAASSCSLEPAPRRARCSYPPSVSPMWQADPQRAAPWTPNIPPDQTAGATLATPHSRRWRPPRCPRSRLPAVRSAARRRPGAPATRPPAPWWRCRRRRQAFHSSRAQQTGRRPRTASPARGHVRQSCLDVHARALVIRYLQ